MLSAVGFMDGTNDFVNDDVGFFIVGLFVEVGLVTTGFMDRSNDGPLILGLTDEVGDGY